MNKHRFFFNSISFVRISYKTIWLRNDLDIKPTENRNLEGLKLVFSKRCASKIWWGVSEVRLKKYSNPSPWKRRKTTSSAVFCATGAWGLTMTKLLLVRNKYSGSYLCQIFSPIWMSSQLGRNSWRNLPLPRSKALAEMMG